MNKILLKLYVFGQEHKNDFLRGAFFGVLYFLFGRSLLVIQDYISQLGLASNILQFLWIIILGLICLGLYLERRYTQQKLSYKSPIHGYFYIAVILQHFFRHNEFKFN